MTSEEIQILILQDREEGIECNFDMHTMERYTQKYGLFSRVSIGRSQIKETEGDPVKIRYAVCPICNIDYYALKDADSCYVGHSKSDVAETNREFRKKRIDKIKAESVFQYGFTLLMSKKYAVISQSRTLAENFALYSHPAECLVINKESDILKILTKDGALAPGYQLVFLGRPTNYMKHFALNHSFIREELERIETIRDAEYLVQQGEDFIMVDKWDLEDFKGQVFVRTLIDGRPAYSKQ
jgi:hypothetical protein